MNIKINIAELRPSTLAAMIADLMDNPGSDLRTIKALLNQLEVTVGDEGHIEFLIDAGVTPESLIEMWDLVAE